VGRVWVVQAKQAGQGGTWVSRLPTIHSESMCSPYLQSVSTIHMSCSMVVLLHQRLHLHSSSTVRSQL
jgi:hypothetical protein